MSLRVSVPCDHLRRKTTRARRTLRPLDLNKTSADCCVSEVPLHCKELGLGAVFSIGELHSTSLHVFQLILVCPIPVYVSDYPRVFEVNQGVVDKETTSG